MLLSHNFPALRILRVKTSVRSVGDDGAAPAIRKQLAFGAFLKLLVLAVTFHLVQPNVAQAVGERVSNFAVRNATAGVNIAGWKNCQVAVSAVAASVNHIFFSVFRNLEAAFFVVEERPQVVLLVAPEPPFSCKIKIVVIFKLFVALEQKLVIPFVVSP